MAKATRPLHLVVLDLLVDRAQIGEEGGGGLLSGREAAETLRLRKEVLAMPPSGLRRLNTARDPVQLLPPPRRL